MSRALQKLCVVKDMDKSMCAKKTSAFDRLAILIPSFLAVVKNPVGILLFFLLVTVQSVCCQEPTKIDFKSLKDVVEKQSVSPSQNNLIEIKGFLYELPEGGSILSAEPNLKSCCVGSKKKNDTQIFIKNIISKIQGHTAVVMQGDLHVSPTYGKDGEWIALYYLDNAKIVETNNFSLSILFYGLIAILGILFFWSIIRK